MNRSSLTAAWTSTFGAARHAVHATCWVLQGGSRVDPPACPRPADKRCYVRKRGACPVCWGSALHGDRLAKAHGYVAVSGDGGSGVSRG